MRRNVPGSPASGTRPRRTAALGGGVRGTVAAALDALIAVEGGAFIDRWLVEHEARLADSRDRRLLHQLVLTTLRWQGALDIVLRSRVSRAWESIDRDVRSALRLLGAMVLVLEHPRALAADRMVALMRQRRDAGVAGLINALARRLPDPGEGVLSARQAVPAWLVARWERRFGGAADDLCAALQVPPRPFLAVHPERLNDSDAELPWEPSRFHRWGRHVLKGAPGTSRGYRDGYWQPLDEAAALVAALAAPRDDRPVYDLAAAPGGKAILISWLGRGPLVALESVPSRLERLRRNVARAVQPGEIGVVLGDALHPPLDVGAAGLVLLDAPCSGTGTLRRRPDKRWRLAEEQIASAAAAQREMLAAAASLVPPGGELVYAVCSLEPEEGIDQVQRFLVEHPAFEALDPRDLIVPLAIPAVFEGLVGGDPPLLQTRPDLDGMEGFVAARLKRRALGAPIAVH